MRLLRDEALRPVRSRVTGAAPVEVLLQAPPRIGADAGVETAILAFEQVQEPDAVGFGSVGHAGRKGGQRAVCRLASSWGESFPTRESDFPALPGRPRGVHAGLSAAATARSSVTDDPLRQESRHGRWKTRCTQ
ncbi:hypothetical protein [Solimonas flava]|uniref:hypothetical protein n=1 Tax=Solimonas flava TaxID=415849 RepID=UPI001FE17119|nr:hypothetical protein [Solimonas flava]